MASMKNNTPSESGNVFIFILLGIVLFAALGFVVSRGMRSETTSAMSQRQAELTAVDIMAQAQKIERGVNRLLSKGCSENNLTFENAKITGHVNPSAPVNFSCHVFQKAGGGVQWQDKSSKSLTSSSNLEWEFQGRNIISGINTSQPELLAVYDNIISSVCMVINDKLGITNPAGAPPVESSYNFEAFVGNFLAPHTTIGDEATMLEGKMAGCFTDDTTDKNLYYHVLSAR